MLQEVRRQNYEAQQCAEPRVQTPPEMEKLGILGPTDKSRRRPGDVSIKNWSLRRGLAIDVAVIHPLAASHLHSQEPCESYAKTQKIDRYAPAFVNSDYDFAPVVFETSGAVNKEGENVLRQIIRFASKREGVTHTVYAARAWARLSCCVQFAAANFEPRLVKSQTLSSNLLIA